MSSKYNQIVDIKFNHQTTPNITFASPQAKEGKSKSKDEWIMVWFKINLKFQIYLIDSQNKTSKTMSTQNLNSIANLSFRLILFECVCVCAFHI